MNQQSMDKNTLEEHEQGLEFVSFQPESQNQRREKCEIREKRESSKNFLHSACPLFIGPGRGSFAKCVSI
jgi:hypothetical protein